MIFNNCTIHIDYGKHKNIAEGDLRSKLIEKLYIIPEEEIKPGKLICIDLTKYSSFYKISSINSNEIYLNFIPLPSQKV